MRDCDAPEETVFSASIATGVAAYPLLQSLKKHLTDRFPHAEIDVYCIENDFFGHSVTVAGLITAQDLIAQLREKDLHGRLLIPSVMLKSDEDVFLDDYTLSDVENALNVKVCVTENDGAALLDAIINQS